MEILGIPTDEQAGLLECCEEVTKEAGNLEEQETQMEEIAVIEAKVNQELYMQASEETKMKSEQRSAVDTLRLMNGLKYNEELEHHLGLHNPAYESEKKIYQKI